MPQGCGGRVPEEKSTCSPGRNMVMIILRVNTDYLSKQKSGIVHGQKGAWVEKVEWAVFTADRAFRALILRVRK